jgi:hypothetical protein
LAPLIADGRIVWSPGDAADGRVARAFRRHQGTDKGFGRALGPLAADYLMGALAGAGYRVFRARSDWLVPAGDSAMLAALIDGMAAAAGEIEPDGVAVFGQWRARRAAAVSRGGLSVRIGHADVLGLPAHWRRRA